MNKDEQLDMLLDGGLGTISLREIVERAYNLGLMAQYKPATAEQKKLTAVYDRELLQSVLRGLKQINSIKTAPDELSKAIATLKFALGADLEYRATWLANLSVTFYDVYFSSLEPNFPAQHSQKFIKNIADVAAENFLKLLCAD